MLRESEKQLYGNEQYEGFGIDLIMEMANLEDLTIHLSYKKIRAMVLETKKLESGQE